jgi:hypothetical protein
VFSSCCLKSSYRFCLDVPLREILFDGRALGESVKVACILLSKESVSFLVFLIAERRTQTLWATRPVHALYISKISLVWTWRSMRDQLIGKMASLVEYKSMDLIDISAKANSKTPQSSLHHIVSPTI